MRGSGTAGTRDRRSSPTPYRRRSRTAGLARSAESSSSLARSELWDGAAGSGIRRAPAGFPIRRHARSPTLHAPPRAVCCRRHVHHPLRWRRSRRREFDRGRPREIECPRRELDRCARRNLDRSSRLDLGRCPRRELRRRPRDELDRRSGPRRVPRRLLHVRHRRQPAEQWLCLPDLRGSALERRHHRAARKRLHARCKT